MVGSFRQPESFYGDEVSRIGEPITSPNGTAHRDLGIADLPQWSLRGWFFPSSERERRLERRVRELETELEVSKLQNELLAELNEDLRRWLLANTSAAAGIAAGFGFREKGK